MKVRSDRRGGGGASARKLLKPAALALALAAGPLLADEVHLKGGGRISGVIVDRNADTVTVDIGGGTLGVKMSTVLRIEESHSPLQEYRKRAADLAPGDAEGWRELARWAEGEALSTQAREAWNRVLKVAPGDAEANAAVGRVELDGKWVTEEESYLARGFVEFEGDWVTPEERLAILESREREEQEHRAAVDAEIAANQRAVDEREAQQQAEHDAYWNSLNNYSDPFYWGYGGGGVAYWPTTPGRRVGGAGAGRPAQMPARAGGARR